MGNRKKSLLYKCRKHALSAFFKARKHSLHAYFSPKPIVKPAEESPMPWMNQISLKAVLIAVLILLLNQSSAAQGGWLELLDFENEDWGQTVIEVPDGSGYYIAGSRMIKTDRNGQIKWARESPVPNARGGQEGSHHLVLLSNDNVARLSRNQFDLTFVVDTYNPDGELVWSESYPDSGFGAAVISIIPTLDGNLLTVGYYFSFGCNCTRITLRKIDEDGNEIWATETGDFTTGLRIETVMARSDGQYLLGGSLGNQALLALVDEDGNLVSENIIFNSPLAGVTAIKETIAGEFIIAGSESETGLPDDNIPYTGLYDAAGGEIWRESYPENPLFFPQDIVLLETGEFVVTGTEGLDALNVNGGLWKLDSDGNTIWFKPYNQFTNQERIFSAFPTPDGGFIMTGVNRTTTPPNIQDILLLKADELGDVYDLLIQGNVFRDEELDCTYDGIELGIGSWIVKAEGTRTFYALTDENGNYTLNVEEGNYEISAISPEYWAPCPLPSVQVDSLNDTLTINLPAQRSLACPNLTVDISTTVMRLCSEGIYNVNYWNRGTSEALDATVEVTFPEGINLLSAAAPIISQTGQTYVFDIGTINVNDRSSFEILYETTCDPADLGKTLCTVASALPVGVCNVAWTGPDIELAAGCTVDSVKLEIQNLGGDMQEVLEYIVIEDNVILREAGYQLAGLEAESIVIEATGNSTFHLMARREADFPSLLGNPIASVSIEGCGVDINVGVVSEIAEDDGEAWESQDCHILIDTPQPLEKKAAPTGWQSDNLILPENELEYHIQFQNVLSDTAINVVVTDTLSEFLDPATIRPGSSNFKYRWELDGENVVRFIFNDLFLPDSTSDAKNSFGFIKYKIAQKNPANNLGEVIVNKTETQFDFNPPIEHNVVFHTVVDFWVGVTSTTSNSLKELSFSLFPNPLTEVATFRVEEYSFENGKFEIIDNQGKIVRVINFSGNQFQMMRDRLQSGQFFFRISEDEKPMLSGQLVIQ